MGYAIRVKANPDDAQYLFVKNFNSLEEFQGVKNLCYNRRTIGFLESTTITVRTNTLQNFAKDFFFPTLINHALKIHDLALKIICTIAFICLDICTLPIRICTLLPLCIANGLHPKVSHPLYQYLLAHQVPAVALDDHIYLELDYIEGRRGAYEDIVTVGNTLNLIQLPENEATEREMTSRRARLAQV